MKSSLTNILPRMGALAIVQDSPAGAGSMPSVAHVAVLFGFLFGQTLLWASPNGPVFVKPVTPPPVVRSTPAANSTLRVSNGTNARGGTKADGNVIHNNSNTKRVQTIQERQAPARKSNTVAIT